MAPKAGGEKPAQWLTIDEVRIVSDLRIMHSKVDELYQIISGLKQRYSEIAVQRYADAPLLAQDISRVDEIYLWFVKLKEEEDRKRRANQS